MKKQMRMLICLMLALAMVFSLASFAAAGAQEEDSSGEEDPAAEETLEEEDEPDANEAEVDESDVDEADADEADADESGSDEPAEEEAEEDPDVEVDPDDASGFVLVSEAVPDAILEIRYFSTFNFVGERIDGYEEPVALLTREAAEALREVSDDLMEHGYRLKIYDAYRPQAAVDRIVNWAQDNEDVRMKDYFYPDLEKDELLRQGRIEEITGSSRGSAVDLTLFDMETGKEIDMGGSFDYFGELSRPDYAGVTKEQYANRMVLRQAMIEHGFLPSEEEWWHFTLEDEPYPDTCFTFPVCAASVAAAPEESADAEEEAAPAETLKSSSQKEKASPAWVTELPAAQDEEVQQLFVVAGMGMDTTTASVSMHERDKDGAWRQILSTPAFIGKNGMCADEDHAEGCGQTPIGAYFFNRAFGIADDPGCAIPYTKVGESTYWSGDDREGMRYNQMVDIEDYPDLDLENSEHIVDYAYEYQYCLNISFNELGEAGRGSAIFLHCLGTAKPYTGGCVAIPENIMRLVMQRVRPDCVVVIDTLENMGGKL